MDALVVCGGECSQSYRAPAGRAPRFERFLPQRLATFLVLCGALQVLLPFPNADAQSCAARLGFPQRVFQVGNEPRSLIAADLNADGRLDLATANNFSGDVSVLAGKEDGTLSPEERFDAGGGPWPLIAADLNADGRLDLATANVPIFDVSGYVSVLLGNVDGTFQGPDRFGAGNVPLSLIAADLNADGRLDLATANESSGDVAVLLGFLSPDCNHNAILDHCDIRVGSSMDNNQDGVPDECELRHRFRRGDCDGDGKVTGSVTDAIFLLHFLFLGGVQPPCLAACDSNSDGAVAGVTDPIFILNFNFIGGSAPSDPFPDCGAGQPSDAALGCQESTNGCSP